MTVQEWGALWRGAVAGSYHQHSAGSHESVFTFLQQHHNKHNHTHTMADQLPPDVSVDATPEARVNNADAKRYWEAISADDDGMLGGFAFVSRADLRGSRTFLAKLGIGSKPGLRRVARALEGGAGIGRITEGMLLDIADEVDVIEPVAKFTEALAGKPGVRRIFNVGLEGWSPDADSTDGGLGAGLPVYGLVWTQWCTGYLNDDQFVEYLRRCRTVLEPGTGVVVIKENLTNTGIDDFDTQDSSVTR